MEMAFLVSFTFLQYARIVIGGKGNRIESRPIIMFMMFLTIFSIFSNIFFIRLQTYVLLVEAVLQFIAVGFSALECILGIILLIMISKEEFKR
mmetsp:Transcript_11372/g.11377  ORF Transcript_11372/g.11377 Transcript_11372/m.11377 type:complete len:93 (+) Transcript_11372:353-631(+)